MQQEGGITCAVDLPAQDIARAPAVQVTVIGLASMASHREGCRQGAGCIRGRQGGRGIWPGGAGLLEPDAWAQEEASSSGGRRPRAAAEIQQRRRQASSSSGGEAREDAGAKGGRPPAGAKGGEAREDARQAARGYEIHRLAGAKGGRLAGTRPAGERLRGAAMSASAGICRRVDGKVRPRSCDRSIRDVIRSY